MRIKSSTPRHEANFNDEPVIETSPEHINRQQISEPDLQVSLKKELGIEEDYDGSPHRFFDWAKVEDNQYASDPDSYITVEEQIKRR